MLILRSSISFLRCWNCRFRSAVTSQHQKLQLYGIQPDRIERNNYLPIKHIPSRTRLHSLFRFLQSGGPANIHQYIDRLHREKGPLVWEKFFGILFVADVDSVQQVFKGEGKYPEIYLPEPWIIYNETKGIQRGLFFTQHEEWAEMRSLLNKFFLKPNFIEQYSNCFNDVNTDLLSFWDKQPKLKDGSFVVTNLPEQINYWSMESIGTMLFGRRLGFISKDDDELSPELLKFLHSIQTFFAETFRIIAFSSKLAYRLQLPAWKRFEKAMDDALQFASIYVKSQKKSQFPGVMQHLTENGTLDHLGISSIIVDLFIAADTTSYTTQFTLALIAKHQSIQEELFQEIQLITDGQPINGKHLARMSYLKAVIKESMRLYPAAPFLTRVAPEDGMVVGQYYIPKKVAISLYTMGRMEKYYEQPEIFSPSRWIRDKSGKNQVENHNVYVPFGFGVRSCIGRRVAEMEMQLLLSRVVQKYKIKPVNDRDIETRMRGILTPDTPVELRFEPR